MTAPHPTSPLARVLERVARFKKSGRNYAARCPAHEDRVESLSIAEGRDGRVVLNCHAGCSPIAVVEALGLQMTDLFPADRRGSTNHVTDPTLDRPSLVKTYDYTDEDGTLLYQACRFAYKDGRKTFRQRRPDPEKPGQWLWSLGETRKVLYRLPDVIEGVAKGQPVFVVEGEKDVETLVECGYVATTAAMGAGKWEDDYATVLTGATVYVIPDNDEPGRTHATMVAGSCYAAGCVVKVLALPGLPLKGDVTDWLEGGHTLDELDALVGQTPTYAPDAGRRRVWSLRELLENDSIMRPPPPIIPRLAWAGRSTLVAAREKSGKSTLIGYCVTQVSRGGQFLGDPCTQGPVLVVGLEEFVGDLARRLRHFGADPQRVTIITGFDVAAKDRAAQLRADIQKLDPVLVVVDSLAAFGRGLWENENDSAQAIQLVQPLTDMAHELGVALALIHHASKGSGRARGSTAIMGAVDMVVEMDVPDEDNDPTRRRVRSAGRLPGVPPRYDVHFDGDTYVLADAGTKAPLETRILSVVRDRPGCSVNDVADAVGARKDDVVRCIKRMLAGGQVRNESVDTRWMKLYVPAWMPNMEGDRAA